MNNPVSLTFGAAACLGVMLSWAPGGRAETTEGTNAGRITPASFRSAALGEELAYFVYLPAGYAASNAARFPVLYLLHGRGDSREAWRTIQPDLDRMIAAGQIPPVIAVMPDAPSNQRAG